MSGSDNIHMIINLITQLEQFALPVVAHFKSFNIKPSA